MLEGKDAGTSEISIRAGSKPRTIVFTNHVTGKFDQRWEAVAFTDFTPVSAWLSFGGGSTGQRTFELHYDKGHVTGYAIPRHSTTREKVRVDVEVLPDTIDQRIDWAAAISQTNLKPATEFEFHVFDPVSGNSRVTGEIVGSEKVRVPAGEFEAVRIVYRIAKSGGTETYQVLTNSEGPRMLIREEFPNGAITQLVRAEQ
jgi:hypothetical protein